MGRLRMGIVGVGRMGAVHAGALSTVEAIDVVAVADTDRSRAESIAAEIGATACGSPDELLERDDVEAWLVATPTPTHPGLVVTALEAGMHVLCEKPLSLMPAESNELGALAARFGRVLQVGFWRRFSPPWSTAKRLLDAGAIGRPLLLRLSQWDADPPPASFCDPSVSGGLAIDCGVHEFDLAEWLTGQKIESVTATNLPVVEASIARVGDVDNLVSTLQLSDGAVAVVDLSRNCRYGDDVRTEILGEDGAIFVDLLPTGLTRLATARGEEAVAGSDAADATGAGVRAQAEAFSRRIHGEAVDVPEAVDNARAVLVGRAVQESAREGSVVPVPRCGSTPADR